MSLVVYFFMEHSVYFEVYISEFISFEVGILFSMTETVAKKQVSKQDTNIRAFKKFAD